MGFCVRRTHSGTALGELTWQVIVMAVLSLTIARMGPVAIAMIGTKLRASTILYMGWFGPRGLATIVFAALVEWQRYANWYRSHDDPTKLAEGKAVHHHELSPQLRHAMAQTMAPSSTSSNGDTT